MTIRNGLAGAARRSILPTLATKLWFGAFLIMSVADVAAEFAEAKTLTRILIFFPMPLLFGYVLARVRPAGALVRWLLAAIVFSWLGDAFGQQVIVKIAFFAVAQICYLVAFLPFWRNSVVRRPQFLILYAIATVAMIVFLIPYAANLAIPVIGYALLVGTMAVLATGLGRLGVIGGLLFFVSDTILALMLFVPSMAFPTQGAWVMITYLGAQAVLAIAVLARVPAEAYRAG
jgi:uncharacterized membrane protein YhhN